MGSRIAQAQRVARLLFPFVWVAGMALILLSFGALVRLPDGTIQACQRQPVHLVSPPLIIFLSVLCFLLGAFMRQARARSASPRPGAMMASVLNTPNRATLLAFAILPLLFLFVAVLLAYETYAVADTKSWPITSYIRCAYAVAPRWTALGACSLSLLFGHWFG
jgi:hypothetical protein